MLLVLLRSYDGHYRSGTTVEIPITTGVIRWDFILSLLYYLLVFNRKAIIENVLINIVDLLVSLFDVTLTKAAVIPANVSVYK